MLKQTIVTLSKKDNATAKRRSALYNLIKQWISFVTMLLITFPHMACTVALTKYNNDIDGHNFSNPIHSIVLNFRLKVTFQQLRQSVRSLAVRSYMCSSLGRHLLNQWLDLWRWSVRRREENEISDETICWCATIWKVLIWLSGVQ